MVAPLLTSLVVVPEAIAVAAGLLVDATKVLVDGAKGVSDAVDDITRARQKIANISQSSAEADATFRRIRDQAQRVGGTIPDIADTHAAASQAMAGLHLTPDQVMQLSENIQKIAINAGSTVKQATENATQFFETLRPGKVDEDDLQGALGAVPGLSNALRDDLAGSTSELTKLAKDGRLATELLIDSILTRTSKINDAFALHQDTGEQLRNRIANNASFAFSEINAGAPYKVGARFVEDAASAVSEPPSLERRLRAAYLQIDEIEERFNALRERPGFGAETEAARLHALEQAQIEIGKLEEERDLENVARRAREAAARQERFRQDIIDKKAAEESIRLAEQQNRATDKTATIREKASREAVKQTDAERISADVTGKQNDEYEEGHKIASALLSGEKDRAATLERCITVLQQYALLCSALSAEQKFQRDCLAEQSRLTDEVSRKTATAATAQKRSVDELARSNDLVTEGIRSRDDADKLAEATREADHRATGAKTGSDANKFSENVAKKADELSRDIADAIYEAGSKGGKGFWEKFQEWGRATIKRLSIDLVLKPIIQPVMTSVVGAIPQLFGIAGSPVAGVNGGGLGSSLSPIGDALGLVKSFVGDTIGNASWINRLGTGLGFGPGTVIPAPLVYTDFGVLPASEFIGPMPLAEGALGTTQTLSGFLGNFGIGFGAGNLLNGLFGGSSTGGMIGSGIGSLIGSGLALIPGLQLPGMLLSILGGAGGGLLGGLFGKDEQTPRGYAGGEIGNNNRFSATDVHQAGLDGYDNSRDRQEMAKFAETMNATMDRYRLSFAVDKDSINSNGAYNGLLTIGTMYGGAKDAADLFMRWFKSDAGAATGPGRVSEDDWMRASGYTRSSTYDRDSGWTYDLRDKAGNQVTQDTWNSEYEKWRDAQKQTTGPGGALFKSDDAYVQKALDRMASGDTKIKDQGEVQKFLEFAGSFKDAADRAAAGVDTLKRQTLEWDIAARDAGRALEKTVKDYVKSANDLYGENSAESTQAALTQRQNIFATMRLDPKGQIIAPGTDDRLKGADAEIAQMKAQFSAYQKALEATGLSVEEATAFINRGIESTTAHIRDAHAENDRRREAGFAERETAARIAMNRPETMNLAVGGSSDYNAIDGLLKPNAYSAAQASLAERQRQEIVDAEKAGLSDAQIARLKYIQGLEREAQIVQQTEDQYRVRDGQRAREMQAQFTVRNGPGFDRYNAQREQQIAQHRQELFDAEQKGYTAAQIAGLKYVQGLEEQALTLQQTEDIARIHDGQRAREVQAKLTLRAPGYSQDMAEQEEQIARHRQELFDAQQQGYTDTQLAGLRYVQGLEEQALALQQAERALQKEEAYITRTAQAMVGLLAGSSAQQQGQYLVEDVQRQIAQAQELRNATSEADRARILEIQHLEDASIAVQRAAAAQQQYNEALKTAKGQLAEFRGSINQWLDQQKVNQVGGPTAMASYLAAQQQYNEQLEKVRAGDPGAMGSITAYADRLIAAMQALDQPNAVANLDASRQAFEALVDRARAGDADAMSKVLAQADQYRQIGLNAYGSTEAYQTLVAQIQQTMQDLPDQISPEEMARKAIEKLNEDLVPPTKEQLDVVRSLERISAATKAALGVSGFSLSDQQTAMRLLQQTQIDEVRNGNKLAEKILLELQKAPAPGTPTTPTTPTGPSPMDAYSSLMTLASTVSSESQDMRRNGLSDSEIDRQIETKYGAYRNSLLDIMIAQPDLIQQFGLAYWQNLTGPGPAHARYLLSSRGIMPAFEFGGMAFSAGGMGSAFTAILHHGERVLTNEQNTIFERLSDAILQPPRWTMPAASLRPANDHVVTREMLAEIREQKQQGEKVVTLLAELVTRLAGGNADEATLDDVVDAINRLQPALRAGQALAGARPISKAG
ncbi:MAG: tape measure protein [Ferrovibrionaceae bacterium]